MENKWDKLSHVELFWRTGERRKFTLDNVDEIENLLQKLWRRARAIRELKEMEARWGEEKIKNLIPRTEETAEVLEEDIAKLSKEIRDGGFPLKI